MNAFLGSDAKMRHSEFLRSMISTANRLLPGNCGRWGCLRVWLLWARAGFVPTQAYSSSGWGSGPSFLPLKKVEDYSQASDLPRPWDTYSIQSDPQLRKKPHHVNTFITAQAVFEILKDILFLPPCHF